MELEDILRAANLTGEHAIACRADIYGMRYLFKFSPDAYFVVRIEGHKHKDKEGKEAWWVSPARISKLMTAEELLIQEFNDSGTD